MESSCHSGTVASNAPTGAIHPAEGARLSSARVVLLAVCCAASVASNILSDRLKMLVDAGVFDVVPASDGTAYQEYVLTKKGEGLFPVIVMLRQWGEANLFARGERHSVLIDRGTGRAIRKLALRHDDGRPLKAADTVVKKIDDEAGAARR